MALNNTSCGGRPRLLAAAKKTSGAGFRFSNRSAEMMESKLQVTLLDNSKARKKTLVNLYRYILKSLPSGILLFIL